MKKIVTILAASMMLFAVNALAQPSIGAGYLSSTEISKSGNTSTESNPMNGFYAGLSYTVPVVDELSFTPGVYYGLLFKDNATGIGPISISGKQRDHYINVPLHFSYGLDLSPDFRFFAYAGPSVSLGVASKVTSSVGTSSGSYDRYQENSDLNRFDILVGGGVGVEIMNMFRLNIGYDMGMLNRYNNTNTAYRRNQLTAGVAFLFSKLRFPLQDEASGISPGRFIIYAEEEGFEPPERCRSTVFKTAAIDHSAIPPGWGCKISNKKMPGQARNEAYFFSFSSSLAKNFHWKSTR